MIEPQESDHPKSLALDSEATHDSEKPEHMDQLLRDRDDRNQNEFVQSRESIDQLSGLINELSTRDASRFKKGPVNVNQLAMSAKK